jgi:site-specific recombinase XerD
MEKIKTYSINEKTRFEDTIKYLTKSEMNSLIEASNFSSVRDKLILSTLYDSGRHNLEI